MLRVRHVINDFIEIGDCVSKTKHNNESEQLIWIYLFLSCPFNPGLYKSKNIGDSQSFEIKWGRGDKDRVFKI